MGIRAELGITLACLASTSLSSTRQIWEKKDEHLLEPLTGTAVLNGVPVSVEAAAPRG